MKKVILCILSIALAGLHSTSYAIASRLYGAIPRASQGMQRIYTVTGRSNPLFQPLGLKTRGLGRDLFFLGLASYYTAKGMYGCMRLEEEINNGPSWQLDQETSAIAALLALIYHR